MAVLVMVILSIMIKSFPMRTSGIAIKYFLFAKRFGIRDKTGESIELNKINNIDEDANSIEYSGQDNELSVLEDPAPSNGTLLSQSHDQNGASNPISSFPSLYTAATASPNNADPIFGNNRVTEVTTIHQDASNDRDCPCNLVTPEIKPIVLHNRPSQSDNATSPAAGSAEECAESVHFIRRETIPVTSNGTEYNCEEYSVEVKVPPGVIPSGSTSKLEVGIVQHGPFEFPSNMMPISPIVWVCMQAKEPLPKPISITLPHCITDLTDDDPLKREITFLKAHHLNRRANRDGSKVFHFQKADGWVTFPDATCGELHTSQFCFKCLVTNVTPENAARMGYCLIYAIPNPWPECSVVYINIGITNFLQTCIDTFKGQLCHPGHDAYDIRIKKFNFRDASQPIQVTVKTGTKEWIMTVQEGEEGIRANDVNFWNKEYGILKLMEENKMYPPRFVLSVCSNEAKTSAVASLQFEGTRENTKINIILQHVPQVRRQLTSDGASTRSSHSSFNHMDTVGSDLELDDSV